MERANSIRSVHKFLNGCRDTALTGKTAMFDLDGTLINRGSNTVHQDVYAILAHLRERDVDCIVVTARSDTDVHITNALLQSFCKDTFPHMHQLDVIHLPQLWHGCSIDRQDEGIVLYKQTVRRLLMQHGLILVIGDSRWDVEEYVQPSTISEECTWVRTVTNVDDNSTYCECKLPLTALR